ncbi:MAG: DUF6183 family protein [Polyangia bacterium]
MDASAEASSLLAQTIRPSAQAVRWGALQQRLAAAHAAGEIELLAELGGGPAESLQTNDSATRERARQGLERVLTCLALLPKLGAVQAVLELAARPGVLASPPRGHADGVARRLGAMLGSVQDEATLVAVLAQRERQPLPHTLDVLACWLHEKLLRGGQLEALVPVRRFSLELQKVAHPLGALPLHLLALEQMAPRLAASYGLSHAASWTVPLKPLSELAPRWPAGALVPPVGDVGTPEELGRIGAVWQSACQVSNGKSEARVFLFERPLAGLPLAAELLCSLDLACLRGVAPASVQVQSLEPHEAYGVLLGMAANGGEYNTAWSGAFGRLAAWQSLSGLCGVEPSTNLPSIEHQACRCRWAFFHAPSHWFDRVVSDFAIAAVRPDEESLALLAATDSD